MTLVGRHVRITGRVQGVFFRQSAAERARELGVSGWVRNRPDGSLEAILSGTINAVEAMTNWLRRGPPAARVERIEVEEAQAEHGERFEVRPDG